MIRSGIILALITLAAGCGGGASSPGTTGGSSSGSGGTSGSGSTTPQSTRVFVNSAEQWMVITDQQVEGMVAHVATSLTSIDNMVGLAASYNGSQYYVTDFDFVFNGLPYGGATQVYVTVDEDGANLLASTGTELQAFSTIGFDVNPESWMDAIDARYPISTNEEMITHSYDPATRVFRYLKYSDPNDTNELVCEIRANLTAVEDVYLRSNTRAVVEGCGLGDGSRTENAQVRVALIKVGSQLLAAMVITDFSQAIKRTSVLKWYY